MGVCSLIDSSFSQTSKEKARVIIRLQFWMIPNLSAKLRNVIFTPGGAQILRLTMLGR